MWFEEEEPTYCQLRKDLELRVQELDLCNFMFWVASNWNSTWFNHLWWKLSIFQKMRNSQNVQCKTMSRKFMICTYIGILLKVISFRLTFSEWKILLMS